MKARLSTLARLTQGLLVFMAVVLPSGMAVMRPALATAAAVNPAPAAMVSFTFDDGYANALTKAAPTLAQYGIKGTDYVIANCVGKTTQICVDEATGYMTWDQIKTLKNTYGWEIGSHTMSHPLLSTLTAAQVETELSGSKAALAAQGIDAQAFAAPYGDYTPSVTSSVAKYYTSMRGFADIGYNTWPQTDYLIRTQQLHGGVSVATVKGWIDTAIANKQWLVLTFHDIMDKASTNPDWYEYSTANLAQIAAYVKSKNVAAPTISQGLLNGDNQMPGGDFTAGLGAWTTDSAANITADAATHGNFPGATNAIKLTANATKNVHLFSPQFLIDSAKSYAFKNYLSVQQLAAGGEVAFYIDEYDTTGRWISGQYKTAERSVWTESLNFAYKPTTQFVRFARMQVIVKANAGTTAYFDSARLIQLD